MGVGCGFAIAAALWCRDEKPGKRVVAVQGDSAFGFSGMEVETACRFVFIPVDFTINLFWELLMTMAPVLSNCKYNNV